MYGVLFSVVKTTCLCSNILCVVLLNIWAKITHCSRRIIEINKFSHVSLNIDVSKLFFGRLSHKSNPRRCHLCWRRADKFLKFVTADAVKMHSLALSVLRVICKTFFTFFTLRNTLLRGWFLKHLYIQMKNCCEGIWVEKMQQVIQKKSLEAV